MDSYFSLSFDERNAEIAMQINPMANILNPDSVVNSPRMDVSNTAMPMAKGMALSAMRMIFSVSFSDSFSFGEVFRAVFGLFVNAETSAYETVNNEA